MDDEKQKKILAEIQPLIRNLLMKIEKIDPSLCFTGFLYSSNPPMITHISNITNKGVELAKIHYQLASLLEYQVRHGKQIGPINLHTSEQGPTQGSSLPEDIADQLALSLLASNPETQTNEVKELLDKYIKSRRE